MQNNELGNPVNKQRLKHQSIKDRRKAPRFDASVIPTLKNIRQVGGPEVELINISRVGALIESHDRMSPGSDISLQLVIGEDVFLLKGRIIRCSISSTNDAVFQSAIAFDEDFKLLPTTINLLEDENLLKIWP
jgi:hypothetical protein